MASLVGVLGSIAFAPLASAQRRAPAAAGTTPRSGTAARDAALAAAASLSDAQAHSVFAQILEPLYAPRVVDVQTDVRPNGTRHVFALLEVDVFEECVLDMSQRVSTREARSVCRTERGSWRGIVLAQIDGAGRVFRTRFGLPFALPGGRSIAERQRMRPSTLRLFAPREGEPKVAIVDGEQSLGASRDPAGPEPATFFHDVYAWDGDDGIVIRLGNVSQPNHPAVFDERLSSLQLEEEQHRIVRVDASCEDGCRCTRPTSLTQEASLLARAEAARDVACRPTRTTLSWPEGIHLVDVDLDARTPTLTRDEALAARVPALMAAAAVSESTARAILAGAVSTLVAPVFGRSTRHDMSDHTSEIFVRLDRSEFLECVFAAPAGVERYDRVRACAHRTETPMTYVYAHLGADGALVAPATRLGNVDGFVAAGMLTPDPAGPAVWVMEGFSSQRVGNLPPFFRHEVRTYRLGQFAHVAFIGETSGTPTSAHPAAAQLGELVFDEAHGSALLRQARCTAACPCDPLPETVEAERAMLRARTDAAPRECRVREVVFDGLH